MKMSSRRTQFPLSFQGKSLTLHGHKLDMSKVVYPWWSQSQTLLYPTGGPNQLIHSQKELPHWTVNLTVQVYACYFRVWQING